VEPLTRPVDIEGPGPLVHADHVDVPERLVVAPAAGVFRPEPGLADAADAGGTVEAGQTLGSIERVADAVDVVSPHTGRLMGLLVFPGERVRDLQPVAWLRLS
jgi:[acyl-carrier-protein] S-malonyltransferase